MQRDLPTFSGKPEEWPAFEYEFRSSSQICAFTDVENLHRLKKSLVDKANEAVTGLLILPNQVGVIMKILTRRFGRPKMVIEALIQRVGNLSPLKENKLENIIEFNDEIKKLSQQRDTFKRKRMYE